MFVILSTACRSMMGLVGPESPFSESPLQTPRYALQTSLLKNPGFKATVFEACFLFADVTLQEGNMIVKFCSSSLPDELASHLLIYLLHQEWQEVEVIPNSLTREIKQNICFHSQTLRGMSDTLKATTIPFHLISAMLGS